ncbi:LOB domain containing-protein [Proteus mirabilis]|nr:LOB domain containing-protein [Proteus mirabilis]
MSCNACKVLRKGCREDCILRQSIQWIDSAQAQGYATLFVAKFFGRAGLLSFISNVPLSQRPGLFQSLLFEACGRTVNPVSGAVGLMWTGNWHLCQTAVDTVLKGGTIAALPEFLSNDVTPESGEVSEIDFFRSSASHRVGGRGGFMETDQQKNDLDAGEEESETTTFESSWGSADTNGNYCAKEVKLLRLFL